MKAIRTIAALALASAVSLTACTNPGATGGQTDNTGVPTDGTAAVNSKTLTVWTNTAAPEWQKNVYKRFGEKYGVTFNFVNVPGDAYEAQVQTKWSSGDRPDILEFHATSLFWALNPTQNLVDLSKMPFVAKSGDLYKSVGSLDNKVYAAVTQGPGELGVFYNKKVFAKNGLQPPKTYADLQNICTTLKAKDPSVTPIYEAGGSAWPTQILGGMLYMSSAMKSDWAQQVIDKKTTMDAPDGPFVKGLTAYRDLGKNGCYNKDATTGKYERSVKAVADGAAAMTAQGGDVTIWNSQFGGDTAKTDANVGFAAVSSDGATASWGPSFNGTWLIPKTGKTDTESTALAFLQYATGEGYQQMIDESKTFPVLSGATDPVGIQELQKQMVADYRADSSLAFNSNLVGFNTQFPTYTTGILAGQQTPEEAAKKAQVAFEQGAKAAALPGW